MWDSEKACEVSGRHIKSFDGPTPVDKAESNVRLDLGWGVAVFEILQ